LVSLSSGSIEEKYVINLVVFGQGGGDLKLGASLIYKATNRWSRNPKKAKRVMGLPEETIKPTMNLMVNGTTEDEMLLHLNLM
jgi:hypothetical protein